MMATDRRKKSRYSLYCSNLITLYLINAYNFHVDQLDFYILFMCGGLEAFIRLYLIIYQLNQNVSSSLIRDLSLFLWPSLLFIISVVFTGHIYANILPVFCCVEVAATTQSPRVWIHEVYVELHDAVPRFSLQMAAKIQNRDSMADNFFFFSILFSFFWFKVLLCCLPK